MAHITFCIKMYLSSRFKVKCAPHVYTKNCLHENKVAEFKGALNGFCDHKVYNLYDYNTPPC